jgi:uncharacterized repeat protein (TIGR01451 family)
LPVNFTEEQIEAAIAVRLSTEVVYLEQPQLAVVGDLTQAMLSRVLPPDRNLLIEADRVGRPMALVRLGGRLPDERHFEPGFFGPPVPLAPARFPERPSGAVVPPKMPRPRDRATTFTPAVPRSEIEGVNARRLASRRGLLNPTLPRPFASIDAPRPPYELFPDEYLFDGGDRGWPVHAAGPTRAGLETEDAVAEYADTLGVGHILPTNRVAIYSPRFGRLSTTTGLETGVTIEHLANAIDQQRGGRLSGRVAVTDHAQRMPSQSVRVRSRASGFELEQKQVAAQQTTVAGVNIELEGSVEHVQNQNAPAFQQLDIAVIHKRRAAAFVWTRDQYPVISASLAGLHQVSARFVAGGITGIEDRRKPGRLEIAKMADTEVALPGQIVSFVIEYENLGDFELRDVKIVDNLTPRLELVAGSAASDRPAKIAVSDNSEGSVIVTWILDQPLPGHTRGSVTFQAKVR